MRRPLKRPARELASGLLFSAVMELADMPTLGAGALGSVRVQIPSAAQLEYQTANRGSSTSFGALPHSGI